ncbi:MarR family transcriptional regulator [Rhodanobacter sp. Root179]|uniref:MarR family winged helix-turn-helix transcriptional regulator n=1 Tax=Rhodanobacter sp. Root179 TaxID=1736482 RepID=UPI0006F6A589|nr:MarR family winged helix-turn-helix transcriptional regulator [Rhodanobacter sp. Root179]KRB45821.1 MarR family transcriptional regulator [Rhodanobacter sp. Root179]
MNKPSVNPAAADAMATAVELRVLVGKLRRRLREQINLGGLPWSQVSVIGHLERDGPATITALAHAEGMRPQSMGANVAALLEAGLVRGTPDPDDGRRTLLSLTPACRKLIKASRAAREDWLFHAIQTRLAPKEQARLARAVALLKRLVEP